MENPSSSLMKLLLPLQDFKPSVKIHPFTTSPAELLGLDLYADVAGISLDQFYQYVKAEGLLSAAAEEGLRRRVEEQTATAGEYSGKKMVKNDVSAVVEKKKTANNDNVVVDQEEEEDYSSEIANHKASRNKLIKRQMLQKSKRRPKNCGNIYSLLD